MDWIKSNILKIPKRGAVYSFPAAKLAQSTKTGKLTPRTLILQEVEAPPGTLKVNPCSDLKLTCMAEEVSLVNGSYTTVLDALKDVNNNSRNKKSKSSPGESGNTTGVTQYVLKKKRVKVSLVDENGKPVTDSNQVDNVRPEDIDSEVAILRELQIQTLRDRANNQRAGNNNGAANNVSTEGGAQLKMDNTITCHENLVQFLGIGKLTDPGPNAPKESEDTANNINSNSKKKSSKAGNTVVDLVLAFEFCPGGNLTSWVKLKQERRQFNLQKVTEMILKQKEAMTKGFNTGASGSCTLPKRALAVLWRGDFIREPLILKPIRDVVNGLEYLHSFGITHQFVSPEVIGLGKDGNWKLAYFENSAKNLVIKLKDSDEAEMNKYQGYFEQLLPNVLYRPPEIADLYCCRADADISFPVDMWQLGTLIYQLMFSGKHPFFKDLPTPILSITQSGYELPRDYKFNDSTDVKEVLSSQVTFSPVLERIMHWCLAKHPRDRPTSKELSAVLKDWLGNSTKMGAEGDDDDLKPKSPTAKSPRNGKGNAVQTLDLLDDLLDDTTVTTDESGEANKFNDGGNCGANNSDVNTAVHITWLQDPSTSESTTFSKNPRLAVLEGVPVAVLKQEAEKRKKVMNARAHSTECVYNPVAVLGQNVGEIREKNALVENQKAKREAKINEKAGPGGNCSNADVTNFLAQDSDSNGNGNTVTAADSVNLVDFFGGDGDANFADFGANCPASSDSDDDLFGGGFIANTAAPAGPAAGGSNDLLNDFAGLSIGGNPNNNGNGNASNATGLNNGAFSTTNNFGNPAPQPQNNALQANAFFLPPPETIQYSTPVNQQTNTDFNPSPCTDIGGGGNPNQFNHNGGMSMNQNNTNSKPSQSVDLFADLTDFTPSVTASGGVAGNAASKSLSRASDSNITPQNNYSNNFNFNGANLLLDTQAVTQTRPSQPFYMPGVSPRNGNGPQNMSMSMMNQLAAPTPSVPAASASNVFNMDLHVMAAQHAEEFQQNQKKESVVSVTANTCGNVGGGGGGPGQGKASVTAAVDPLGDMDFFK